MVEPCTSSGEITSSKAVAARPGKLYALHVTADGTNAATVIVYDNATTNSGTILAEVVVKAGETLGAPQLPNAGVLANNGIYVSISGTGAKCVVHFTLGN